MLEVSLHEDDYHSTTILTDEMTLEGLSSFVKLFTEISGNQRISLKIDGEKFKPNKKYLYEKNIRRIPSEIKSNMKYYIVARGSKSYNIYTFDDIRFLSGVYIGIGFCKEDYSYIIRGIGETNLKIVQKEEEREDRDDHHINHRKKESRNTTQVKKIIEKQDEVEKNQEDSRTKSESEYSEVVTSTEPRDEPSQQSDESKLEGTNENHVEKSENQEDYESETEKKNVVITKRSPKIRLSPRRSTKKKISPMNPVNQNLSLLSMNELKSIAKNENINIDNLTKKTDIVEKIREKLNE